MKVCIAIASALVAAAAAMNANATDGGDLGVINGRVTNPGEWEGTVMVIGANGECTDSGLCTGMLIHPSVVMTAGHCCASGATKAICGGKYRDAATKLAQSIKMVSDNSGANDFCLLHLDTTITDIPVYEVATEVGPFFPENAVIVGYGVSNSGTPQAGSGVQREGLVNVVRVSGVDITVTGRPGQTYQNGCNGDSGGPIFVASRSDTTLLQVAGVTSRGSLYCPANSNGIWTSAVFESNADLIRDTTRAWLGPNHGVVPGKCPVDKCCYSMRCDGGYNSTAL
jgi:hypothetical protein